MAINYLSVTLTWISLVINETEHVRMGYLLAIYISLQHETGDAQWTGDLVEVVLFTKERKAVEE